MTQRRSSGNFEMVPIQWNYHSLTQQAYLRRAAERCRGSTVKNTFLAKTEVRQHDVPLIIQENILRLQVPE